MFIGGLGTSEVFSMVGCCHGVIEADTPVGGGVIIGGPGELFLFKWYVPRYI